MHICLEDVFEIYDKLSLSKETGEIVEFFYFVLSLNQAPSQLSDESFNRMKMAEDFHTVCHLFNKKHKTTMKIDNIDLHRWIGKIRTGKLEFDKVRIKVSKIKPKKNESI